MNGSITIIGLGPGSLDLLPPSASQSLENADVIVGYQKYLKQIEGIFPQIPRSGSGMRHEMNRAQQAIDFALQGKKVAVVSGGDAGIYGMAGIVLELLDELSSDAIPVEIIPGISALNSAAALLGAPLMNDFAVISLSDCLTPLPTIIKRLEAAVQGDFVICLYNPRGHRRIEPFNRAMEIFSANMEPERPIGVVRNAFRETQQVVVTQLKNLQSAEIGMDCILIIGNQSTRVINGKMITPRGYPIQNQPEE